MDADGVLPFGQQIVDENQELEQETSGRQSQTIAPRSTTTAQLTLPMCVSGCASSLRRMIIMQKKNIM